MKMHSLSQLTMVTALAWGASLNARAAIDLTFTWNGSYYKSGYADSAGYINSADAIGIYHFNASNPGDPTFPSEFYSVCLDPHGLLDTAPHSYDVLKFSDANPGKMPANWAWGKVDGKAQYWGVNNAAFLWNTYGMSIVNSTDGHQNEQAAALEFAIWNTLYNSTGYGQVAGHNWTAPTGQMDTEVRSFYNTFNAAVLGSLNGPIYAGNILRGTDYTASGQQQEFFMLETPIHASGMTPVPEPSTMIAGSVALLSFGASMFRRQRRTI